MFSHEMTRTYTCPVCDASTERTTKQNMNSRPSGKKVGECEVCGWERESKPSRSRNATPVSYVTIPESASPREGIKRLAANAGISVDAAVEVLNPDTDTSLEDVSRQ